MSFPIPSRTFPSSSGTDVGKIRTKLDVWFSHCSTLVFWPRVSERVPETTPHASTHPRNGHCSDDRHPHKPSENCDPHACHHTRYGPYISRAPAAKSTFVFNAPSTRRTPSSSNVELTACDMGPWWKAWRTVPDPQGRSKVTQRERKTIPRGAFPPRSGAPLTQDQKGGARHARRAASTPEGGRRGRSKDAWYSSPLKIGHPHSHLEICKRGEPVVGALGFRLCFPVVCEYT